MAHQHAKIGRPAGDSYIEVDCAGVEVDAGQSDAVHVPIEWVGHGSNA